MPLISEGVAGSVSVMENSSQATERRRGVIVYLTREE